jgi:gamma-glutamyl-gamma-aminobutyrate hydrolase PuuD
MTAIAITSAELSNPSRYMEVLESLEAEVRLITSPEERPTDALMRGVGGLLLPGGPDIDPSLYGADPDPTADLDGCRALDELDLRLLRYALKRDMPVLAIGRGMQLLNVARDGQLIQDLPGHKPEREHEDGPLEPQRHLIYLAPGAKAAAVIGSAGFFRVNSLHHQGLREAQRSPLLMSTAYSVDDGLIEGLESPAHSWVIGLQCHPERQDEVPRSFANLFAALLERAEMYTKSGSSQ